MADETTQNQEHLRLQCTNLRGNLEQLRERLRQKRKQLRNHIDCDTELCNAKGRMDTMLGNAASYLQKMRQEADPQVKILRRCIEEKERQLRGAHMNDTIEELNTNISINRDKINVLEEEITTLEREINRKETELKQLLQKVVD